MQLSISAQSVTPVSSHRNPLTSAPPSSTGAAAINLSTSAAISRPPLTSSDIPTVSVSQPSVTESVVDYVRDESGEIAEDPLTFEPIKKDQHVKAACCGQDFDWQSIVDVAERKLKTLPTNGLRSLSLGQSKMEDVKCPCCRQNMISTDTGRNPLPAERFDALQVQLQEKAKRLVQSGHVPYRGSRHLHVLRILKIDLNLPEFMQKREVLTPNVLHEINAYRSQSPRPEGDALETVRLQVARQILATDALSDFRAERIQTLTQYFDKTPRSQEIYRQIEVIANDPEKLSRFRAMRDAFATTHSDVCIQNGALSFESNPKFELLSYAKAVIDNKKERHEHKALAANSATVAVGFAGGIIALPFTGGISAFITIGSLASLGVTAIPVMIAARSVGKKRALQQLHHNFQSL